MSTSASVRNSTLTTCNATKLYQYLDTNPSQASPSRRNCSRKDRRSKQGTPFLKLRPSLHKRSPPSAETEPRSSPSRSQTQAGAGDTWIDRLHPDNRTGCFLALEHPTHGRRTCKKGSFCAFVWSSIAFAPAPAPSLPLSCCSYFYLAPRLPALTCAPAFLDREAQY